MENTVEKIDAKTMAYLIAHELEEMRDENNRELDDLDMKKKHAGDTYQTRQAGSITGGT